MAATVPANRGNNAWAPDVHFFSGLWHLYYAYSSFGSKVSGIGLATNPTLDPKAWADQGIVVRTGRDTNYNAIDPCVFLDAGGKPWLSFGSYFSGIKLIALDPATGKQAAGDADRLQHRRPARHPAQRHRGVLRLSTTRASTTYLWPGTPAAPGRGAPTTSAWGAPRPSPALIWTRAARTCRTGGGTLFLGSVGDNGSGRPPDDEVGPGHAGILEDADGDYVSYHEEWARDRGGKTTLNLSKLAWDGDGWPRLVLDPGPYKLVSFLATHPVAEAAGGATAAGVAVRTWFPTGGLGQRWTLGYLGEGYYRLVNAASGKALGVGGDAAKPGTPARIAPVGDRGRPEVVFPAERRWDVDAAIQEQRQDAGPGRQRLLAERRHAAPAVDRQRRGLPEVVVPGALTRP